MHLYEPDFVRKVGIFFIKAYFQEYDDAQKQNLRDRRAASG